MKCPHCKASETKVVDSRFVAATDTIRRRRACPHCGARFTTREVVEVHFPRVVKRSGMRSQFNEDKIRKGLGHACEKRNIDAKQIEKLLSAVKERVITASSGDEIESSVIGELVMSELKALDMVAYIRFASVYQSFSDVDSFTEIISNLKQRNALIGEESC